MQCHHGVRPRAAQFHTYMHPCGGEKTIIPNHLRTFPVLTFRSAQELLFEDQSKFANHPLSNDDGYWGWAVGMGVGAVLPAPFSAHNADGASA